MSDRTCYNSEVRLVPSYIEALTPYQAGLSIEEIQRKYGVKNVAKLGSNENPLGTSPMAVEAIKTELNGLNLYPNGGLDLRTMLARMFDLKVENVIAGSGSEGIMSNIIRAFCAMRTKCSPPKPPSSAFRCWPVRAA